MNKKPDLKNILIDENKTIKELFKGHVVGHGFDYIQSILTYYENLHDIDGMGDIKIIKSELTKLAWDRVLARGDTVCIVIEEIKLIDIMVYASLRILEEK